MKAAAFSGLSMPVRPHELIKPSVFHNLTRNSQWDRLSGSNGRIRRREVEMANPGGNGEVGAEVMEAVYIFRSLRDAEYTEPPRYME